MVKCKMHTEVEVLGPGSPFPESMAEMLGPADSLSNASVDIKGCASNRYFRKVSNL